MQTTLNLRASQVVSAILKRRGELRIDVQDIAGATVIDCGVFAAGGIAAGLELAGVCLSGLGDVSLLPGDQHSTGLPRVQVYSDQPVLACMASQYAGWQISAGKYFAMGSGPMRALYGKEKLFDDISGREQSPLAVGVLEGKLPPPDAVTWIADRLQLLPSRLTLLVARTASIAGNIQVVARSLEMALHKLHELKFDLNQVVSGIGIAPLPPPAKDDLAAIGRTNDAVLYGGQAVVYVKSNDDLLAEIGPKVPSNSSTEYGSLFADLFAKYQDFYKIDPLLFSPAEILFCNLATGRMHRFGKTAPEILEKSFQK